jgi:hypothetical protein
MVITPPEFTLCRTGKPFADLADRDKIVSDVGGGRLSEQSGSVVRPAWDARPDRPWKA